MFSEWRKGARRSTGGSNSELCEPRRDRAVGTADPGQPARGGAQPLQSVQARVDKYKLIKSTLRIARGLMSLTRHSVSIC